MYAAVPEFLSIICPPEFHLEDVYVYISKRTRLAVGRVFLRFVRLNAGHIDAFGQCRIDLEKQITLAHLELQNPLRVFTDDLDFI